LVIDIMDKRNNKDASVMPKTAVKKSATPAQDQLTEMYAKLVHESVSSMSLEEARATKRKVDRIIDQARASRPKRRGTR
jgi:hypothetical protein